MSEITAMSGETATTFCNPVGGERTAPTGRGSIAHINPSATDEVIGHFPVSDEAEVDVAVTAASDAFPAWAAIFPLAWAGIVLQAAILRQRIDEVGRDLTREDGKMIGEARNVVGKLEYTVGEGARHFGEMVRAAPDGMHLCTCTLCEPLGVVAASCHGTSRSPRRRPDSASARNLKSTHQFAPPKCPSAAARFPGVGISTKPIDFFIELKTVYQRYT